MVVREISTRAGNGGGEARTKGGRKGINICGEITAHILNTLSCTRNQGNGDLKIRQREREVGKEDTVGKG